MTESASAYAYHDGPGWLPRRPGGAGTRADELTAFLLRCLGDAEHGLRPHLDLDLGGVDGADLEPLLYRLLGVDDAQSLMLGVSWLSTGDLSACRTEWGEPAHRIDLRRGFDSPLHWLVWQLPAATVIDQNVAGASLVLPAVDPGWVLYTDPTQIHPMLFLAQRPCPAHRGATPRLALLHQHDAG